MSEDRTQAPTKRRWQLARERGHVPRSSELTAAAVLLGASAGLASRGEELGLALVEMIRSPLTDGAGLVAASAPHVVVGRLRDVALGLIGELSLVGGAAVLAGLAAHQAQVRGLWVPGLLAPDVSRLWKLGGDGPGTGSRVRQGVWSLGKGVVVGTVAACFLRMEWFELLALSGLEPAVLASAAGRSLCKLGLLMGVATVALGLTDFFLAWVRFEAMLRMSPEEAREDMRSAEGDPVLRARRRRLARALRGPSVEDLAGASLLLTGGGGLSVVLSGGPPPRRIQIRAIESGARGERLRRAAFTASLREVHDPDLALRLARRRPPSLPLSPDLMEDLARAWGVD